MRFVTIGIVLVFLAACGKEKLESKPSIKIKKIEPSFVPVGGILNVDLEFADKEGDIDDGVIFVIKERINQRVVPTIRDEFELPVPGFPKQSRGTIQLILNYSNHLQSAANPPPLPGNPNDKEDDSLIFRFAIRDRALQMSDTINTDLIVVEN
jgi:hypothetical protein